jgi:hypothetical protein
MIRALSVLAALAVAAPAAAPLDSARGALSEVEGAQSKQFDKTVPLPSGGYLSLHATRGSVKLTSWDRNEVEVRARIQAAPRVDADYARESVDATTVDVIAGAGDVRIRSNYDKVPNVRLSWFGSGWRDVPEIHYEIRAPRKLEIRMDIDRSDAVVRGFEGRVDLVSDRSELTLVDLAGRIGLEVDRGSSSRLENVRGSLRINGDRTHFAIELASLDDRSSIEVDRGDVRIEVPPAQGLTIDADLTRRSGFDADDLQVQRRRGDDRRFTADVNGGGPTLTLESDRGRIQLVKVAGGARR